MKRLLLLLCLAMTLVSYGQEKRLTISGFGEVRMEGRFGEAADEAELDSVINSSGGEEVERYEDNLRLSIPAFTLNFNADLSDRLTIQSEVYFELTEELRLEFLRMYADYRIDPRFNLQVGKFLSTIGYLNRNQRFYGYLNNSIVARDMVSEATGFIPLFTVGLQAYGTFENADGTSAIKYYASYGSSRLSESTEGDDIFGVEFGEDVTPGFSGTLEWAKFSGNTEWNIGVSAYTNPKIETVYLKNGESFEEGVDVGTEIELSETGFAPYIRVNSDKIQFLGEFHAIKFSDEEKVSGKSSYNYNAGSFELLWKMKVGDKPFGPYVRYDFRNMDSYHPYYGLDEEDGVVHKHFVPTQSEVMIGAVADLFPGNRVKVEYGSNFAGAAPTSRFSISTCFAF